MSNSQLSPVDIATIISCYVGITVIAGGVAWKLFKSAVKTVVESNRADMAAPILELTHNGGSSLIDVVKLQILPTVLELRENQKNISYRLARLEGRFDQHLEDDVNW